MILLKHHFVKMTCLHGALVQSIVTGTYLTSNGDVKKAKPHIWYGVVNSCHHQPQIFLKDFNFQTYKRL